MMRWVGHVENKGQNINVYRILVGKTERTWQHKHKGEDKIKMDLKETGGDSGD